MADPEEGGVGDLFKQARELEDATEKLAAAVGDWCSGTRRGGDAVRQSLDVAKMAQQLADACEREIGEDE